MKLSRRVRTFLVAVLAVGLISEVAWRAFRIAVGSPHAELSQGTWAYGLRVLARDGRVLGERASPEGLRGSPTSLDEVSPRLVAATLASEDKAFFDHDGIDRLAIVRALASNLRHGRIVSGASTITSQLVKRIDHRGKARPRSFSAKVVEMARAQNLEAHADKPALLAAYFDRVDYGRGLAGPEAAARGYFGVGARDLSLAQATLLAVIPRAPTFLDPVRHFERAQKRQRALLAKMHERKLISGEDLARALAEPLEVHTPRSGAVLAPHVVMAASEERRRHAALDSRESREAPVVVRTTLDLDLQHDAEALALSHAPRLAERGGKGVALVVVDNATGEVLAEVGSASYFDASRAGAIDLVRRRRQAGSTLKPFVYARAFETGVSPTSMLADVPTEFGTTGAIYAPDNFDGTFVGPISAREALAGSLNVPAVRLARDVGVKDIRLVLTASGLDLGAGPDRHGLSLALGSAEITVLELAEAYATLARGGEHIALRDHAGGGHGGANRVFERSSAALISDALSDPLARVRGLRARGPFEFSYPVAVKTGTSTGFRDAWTAGFSHERTVVVWVGNADGAPTDKLTGAVAAGPLFFDVMKRAMRDVKARAPLFESDLVEHAEVCALSGERAGPSCADHVDRVFARGSAPAHTCSVHRRVVKRAHVEGDAAYACDRQGDRVAVILPEAFDRFLSQRPLGAPGLDAHGLPWLSASRVSGCEDANGSAEVSVRLVTPTSGAVVRVMGERASRAAPDELSVVAETRGLPRDATLDVLVDGRVLAELRAPYKGTVPVGLGDHEIQVRPRDPTIPAALGIAFISVR